MKVRQQFSLPFDLLSVHSSQRSTDWSASVNVFTLAIGFPSKHSIQQGALCNARGWVRSLV